MKLLLVVALTVILVFTPREIAGTTCNTWPGFQAYCDNGECRSRYDWCNGTPDCADGSDETYCESPTGPCNPGSRTCPSGGNCKPASYWCDGYNDCPGSSDELASYCTGECTSEEQTCNDGTCIPSTAWCNGQTDCPDGSDEGSGTCGYSVDHCLKCNGARSLAECRIKTCPPSQKYCKWQDVYTPQGWIFNSGCVAVCANGHYGQRGNPNTGFGVYRGCCSYNGCDSFHQQQ